MRRQTLHALACAALLLPLTACERGTQDADADAAGSTAAATTGAPAAADPVTPAPASTATPPAAPQSSPAAPGAVASPAAPQLQTPLAATVDEVPRMPVAELATLVERGEAVIVDVRDAESFRTDRIQGAVSIPLGEIAARAGELPRDKVIVTYCA